MVPSIAGIPILKELFEVKSKEENFGNGRGVRNCFEKLLEIQANRIVNEKDITDEMLQTISLDDIMKLKEN